MPQTLAIHLASEAGNTHRLIALLATADADAVNAFDRAGNTPLMVAATSPHAGVDTLRALLEHGAVVDATSGDPLRVGETALSMALSIGDIDKVRALLEAGADLHYSRGGCSALIDAARSLRVPARDNDADLLLSLIHI